MPPPSLPPPPFPSRIIVSGITFLLHCEEKRGEEKKLGEEKWTGLAYFSQLCVQVPERVWVSGCAHRMCVMFGVCWVEGLVLGSGLLSLHSLGGRVFGSEQALWEHREPRKTRKPLKLHLFLP